MAKTSPLKAKPAAKKAKPAGKADGVPPPPPPPPPPQAAAGPEDVAYRLNDPQAFGQNMAQVAEMGDANVVDPEDEDRVLAALHAAALVVERGDNINRNIADRRGDFLPVLAARGESVENHRRAGRHVDAVMRAVLVAGSDDMLRQGRPWQVKSPMRVGQDSRAFG